MSKDGWKWKLCPVWRWSNPAIKDILANFLKTEGWVAEDTPLVYFDHINAEAKVNAISSGSGVNYKVGRNMYLTDEGLRDLYQKLMPLLEPGPEVERRKIGFKAGYYRLRLRLRLRRVREREGERGRKFLV